MAAVVGLADQRPACARRRNKMDRGRQARGPPSLCSPAAASPDDAESRNGGWGRLAGSGRSAVLAVANEIVNHARIGQR